ncbi:unnamed protein product [Enterobius vermicularis]|uniref:Thyroid receptor-interacting protein 11 n=1 Tax=Enterobius vermicularis TaxID=51028 RepID=A0A0N4UUT1_ENTVE|nr:unnamed protein product [Enterobius vermicularis]
MLSETISTSPLATAAHMICRGSLKVPCPSNLQLAILAARLTTREADNEALFRCNEEMAETNLRLQNEVDDLRERLNRLSTTVDSDRIVADTDNCQLTSDVDSMNDWEDNENSWGWESDVGVNNVGNNLTRSDGSQIVKKDKDRIKELEKEKVKLQEEVERRDKRLDVAEEYALELEGKIDGLENTIDEMKIELQHLKDGEKLDPVVVVKSSSLNASSQEYKTENEFLQNENKRLLEEMAELKKIHKGTAKKNLGNEEQDKKRFEGSSLSYDENWDKEKDNLFSESQGADVQYEERSGPNVKELKATVNKLNDELSAVIKSREALETELSMSNDRFKTIESDYQKLKEQLTVCKEDIDSVQVPSVETSFAGTVGDGCMLSNSENLETHALFVKNELHLNEESYLALVESEKSLRRLLEGLETKLHSTEEYSVNLSEENASLESTVENLREEILKLNQEVEVLKKSNQLLERDKEESEEKARACDEDECGKEDLKRSLATRQESEVLKRDIKVLESENNALKVELKSVVAAHHDNLRGTGDFAVQVEISDEVVALKKELGEALVEKAALEEKLSSSQKQNELLKDTEFRLTEVVDSYEVAIKGNAVEIEALKKSLQKTDDKCQKLEEERNEWLKEKNDLKNTLDKTVLKFKTVEDEVKQLRTKLKEKSSQRQQEPCSWDSVAGSHVPESARCEASPCGSKQIIVASNSGEDFRKSTDEQNRLERKVAELETKCGGLIDEKKRLTSKLKILQSKMNALQNGKSNIVERIRPSTSSTSNDFFSYGYESSVPRFDVEERSFASPSVDSRKLRNDSDEEKMQNFKSNSDIRVTSSPVQSLQINPNEPVRRRKSGHRGSPKE